MNRIATYPPFSAGRAQRRAAAVALGAGALALITGCSAASSSGSSASSAGSTSPHTALTLAAAQSQKVNSMAATFSSQAAGETTTGSLQLQLKPSLLAGENLKVTADGKTTPMDEVITDKSIYVKTGLLSSSDSAGKPWVEIDYADLKGGLGSALQSLLQNAQSGNPANQTQLLAASKSVHEVGTQVVNGVQTTHYAGTLMPSTAISALSPSLRKAFDSLLQSIKGPISFNIWIDGQHVTRKVTEVEHVAGETVTTTMNVTSVNQSVQVSAPPASQVDKLTASSLSGM